MSETQNRPANGPGQASRQTTILHAVLETLGAPAIRTLEYIGGLTLLTLKTGEWVWRSLTVRKVRIGRPALYSQIVRIGLRSTAVIALVSACIGLILALQMAAPLSDYGAKNNVATIVAVAVVRELGPLIAAIVLTGFAGASIAAELGTMVVGEEIEALEAHALNPVRFLVVPRLLATTLSLVVLSIIGDLVSIGGGYVIGVTALGIPSGIYYDNTIDVLDLADFMTGLWKAAVFGLIIGCISCHNGLIVKGGAAGVGRATTNTVVHSIIGIIVADLIFTAVFYRFGWT